MSNGVIIVKFLISFFGWPYNITLGLRFSNKKKKISPTVQSLRTIESHFLYKQLFLCKNYHINCSKNKTMYELVLEFKNPIKNFYRRCSEYESVTQAKLYKSHFLYTCNIVSFSKHQYAILQSQHSTVGLFTRNSLEI